MGRHPFKGDTLQPEKQDEPAHIPVPQTKTGWDALPRSRSQPGSYSTVDTGGPETQPPLSPRALLVQLSSRRRLQTSATGPGPSLPNQTLCS